MLFPSMLLAAMYWLPESPRYLIAKDRHEQALAILKTLHATAGQSSYFAEIEFLQIRKQIERDKKNRMSYVEIFRRPAMRKRALITIVLPWCMLGSGVLVINSECLPVTREYTVLLNLSRLWQWHIFSFRLRSIRHSPLPRRLDCGPNDSSFHLHDICRQA